MKKIIVLLMVLLLAACSNQTVPKPNDEQQTQNNNPQKDSDTNQDEVKQDDEANNQEITINNEIKIDLLSFQGTSFLKEYPQDNPKLIYKGTQVLLHNDDYEKYPEIKETLEQFANMQKRSMDDEFEFMQEFISEDQENIELVEVDTQLKRGDEKIVSLIEYRIQDTSMVSNTRYASGYNYDTKTGQLLSIYDVVDKMDDFANKVHESLFAHGWVGELYSEDEVINYFVNTPSFDVSFSVDYQGVSVYFDPGVIAEAEYGLLIARVPFKGNEDIFKAKYIDEVYQEVIKFGAYQPLYVNLDKENDLEQLDLFAVYERDDKNYVYYDIASENDAIHENVFANEIYPYYVRINDQHYVHVLCKMDDGSQSITIFHITNGKFTKVDSFDLGFPYLDSMFEYYSIPNDINKIELQDQDYYLTDYTIGKDGKYLKK